MSDPGDVFLLGASHAGIVGAAFERIRKSVGSSPRIAVSAAGQVAPRGDAVGGFIRLHIPGAKVERFSVPGEHDARPSAAESIVGGADVIFLGGGDPVLLAQRLSAGGADQWIRRAHESGAVCVGLSAGSIALAAWWASWPDDAPETPTLVRCVGVVPDLVVDCHAEVDDWQELRAVRHLLEAAPNDGLPMRYAGIGHDAALLVAPGRALEWIGPAKLL